MSCARYVSDVKICLEVLSRFGISPDLDQLEQFLADETYLELINRCTIQIKEAWEESLYASLTDEQIPLESVIAFDSELTPTNAVSLEKKTIDFPDFEEQAALICIENQPEPEVVKLIQQPLQKQLVRFKLPNATVGKLYQEQLEWSDAQKITILGIEGLDGLGLSYDLPRNNLFGEPEKAGEYKLTISYQQHDDLVQATQRAELNLVINSDPKSLWKNMPSDPNQLFWKGDSDYQGKLGHYDWKLAAASKRGRSHAHVGSCRDDDFALQIDNKNFWQIIAVADGAGSSEYSREGARIIAHNSVDVLTDQLQQASPWLDELIEQWQLDKNPGNEAVLEQALANIFSVVLGSSVEAISVLARQQQLLYRDFYSTLLIAAHKSFPQGEFIIAYWIGDGGLGLYIAGRSIELLGVSDTGEYAGQTRFLDINALAQEDLSKRLHISSEKNFTALMLMTDGISDPLFETDNNLRDLSYWDALWQQIQPQLADDPELSAKNLTDWLDFWSPGNHDDRTIALIYR